MSENTILYTHMGMGDGLAQSGMAVALLDRIPGDLYFPCYTQYETTFKSVFAGHPRVKVFTVPHLAGEAWGSPRDATLDSSLRKLGVTGKILRCGVYQGRGCWEDFVKNFYHDADIPYEAMWQRSPVAKAAWNWKDQGNPCIQWVTNKRHVFLHEDNRPPQRNFRIWKHVDNIDPISCEVYKPSCTQETDSVLMYADLINTADEIHCIDSGLAWLVNLLNPRGRLYMHRYARWPRSREFRYETRYHWNYLD